jgi:hypothetical protein
MATGAEVLSLLIPNGGWIITGDDWDGVEFIEATPITQAQFEAGFAQYDANKAEQDAKAVADKAALLAKLGMNQDDLKTLLN